MSPDLRGDPVVLVFCAFYRPAVSVHVTWVEQRSVNDLAIRQVPRGSYECSFYGFTLLAIIYPKMFIVDLHIALLCLSVSHQSNCEMRLTSSSDTGLLAR